MMGSTLAYRITRHEPTVFADAPLPGHHEGKGRFDFKIYYTRIEFTDPVLLPNLHSGMPFSIGDRYLRLCRTQLQLLDEYTQ